MQSTDNLHKLHTSVQRRLEYLKKCHDRIPGSPSKEERATLAHIAIELDNLNVSALREFTFSSLRGAKTRSGVRVVANVNYEKEGEIAAYVLSIANSAKFKKLKCPASISRDQEHTVRDPKTTEKILSACSATNLPSIQSALSLNTSLFREIAPIRHFYAHRCGDTFRKVEARAKASGILKISHPDDYMTTILAGRPQSILADWLVDAQIFYEELMK